MAMSQNYGNDRKPAPLILFVCTGNICRSPMAEYLFRDRIGRNGEWRSASAGLAAVPGLAASPQAVEVLRELGIDLSPHRSQRLSKELVDAAFCVVVMTRSHDSEVRARFPGAKDRLYVLGAFDDQAGSPDIEDPIGFPESVYRTTRDRIDRALIGLAAFLSALEPGGDGI